MFLILVFFTSVAFAGINPELLPVWKGYVNEEVKDSTEAIIEEKENSLQTKGSKSIQTSVGNGGADIQQELRLSIQGEAADGIFVDAYLIDLGRNAGTEITTTLRETDAAYIGIESKRIKLELGDLNYELNNNTLWNFRRTTLGASGKLKGDNAQINAIYGTDKTERQSIIIYGQSSMQKGYLLFANGEFGLIVPGSEKLYLNGVLLTSGTDYEINYAGGVLDFLGQIIPGPEDEIRVEYNSYSALNVSELRGTEAFYRSKFIWLDLAAFNLRDSLKSDKILGARFRSGNSFLFSDLEIAMNEKDNKAYKWFFESDSNSQQKSLVKVSIKGSYLDSGFAKTEYKGEEAEWDAYILRDKWLLDSVTGKDLRYDEFKATMRLPLGLYPGFFIGHRDFKSIRSEGFLQRKTESTESGITFANINAKQDSIKKNVWQSEINSKFLKGFYRPYGTFRIDSKENLRSVSGLELGDENANRYANIEGTQEQTDTNTFSNFKTFISFKEKLWHSNTLFQIRKDSYTFNEAEKSGLSWLVNQSAGYSNPNSFLQGEVSYSFNYTNEVPWVAIYRKVPDGSGDVYYDSLSNQYISGADNGNYVYEGMARVDSLASKSSKNNLLWNLSMHPSVFIKRGVLNDVIFFANGEWLLHKTEKLLLLENSAFWEHSKNKGSLMLTINNKWDTEKQINFKEVLFGQEATAHYTARKKEDFLLRLKREDVEFSFSDLNWLSYEGEFSWLREVYNNFSVQPFYSKKYTTGFYAEESWNATLQKWGVNGKWQNEKNNSAQIGVSGNYVEQSSEISPYSATDGFEHGFSWRFNTMVQIAFNDNFLLSAEYIIRIHKEDIIQKLSAEAKAMF